MTDLIARLAEKVSARRDYYERNMRHLGFVQTVEFTLEDAEALLATIAAQASELEQLRAENVILKDGRCTNCMEPVNPLHLKCACVRAEIDQTSFWLEEENTRLRTALEAQRSDEGYQAWLREKYRETAATIAQQTETIRGLKTALLTALHAVHDLSNLKPHTKHGRWQDCPDAVCRGGAAALTSTEAKG